MKYSLIMVFSSIPHFFSKFFMSNLTHKKWIKLNSGYNIWCSQAKWVQITSNKIRHTNIPGLISWVLLNHSLSFKKCGSFQVERPEQSIIQAIRYSIMVGLDQDSSHVSKNMSINECVYNHLLLTSLKNFLPLWLTWGCIRESSMFVDGQSRA